MKYLKFLFVLNSLGLCLASSSQTNSDRSILGKEYAKDELTFAQKDSKSDNVIDNKAMLIKDSSTVVAVAEPILFSIYGQTNILKQKPYEIYHIDDYWILIGTLKKGWRGGTFLIIMDDRNCRVLKIIHGK